MSLNNLGKLSGTVYQQDVTIAANGILAVNLGTLTNPFLPGCSKILGCVTKTAGGTGFHQIAVYPGVPAIANILAGNCPVTVASTVVTDTSTYTIYWCNSGFASAVSTVDVAAVGQICLC